MLRTTMTTLAEIRITRTAIAVPPPRMQLSEWVESNLIQCTKGTARSRGFRSVRSNKQGRVTAFLARRNFSAASSFQAAHQFSLVK